MIPRKITSLQHPLVKKWVCLRQERECREQERAVLIVGKKLVEEISKDLKLEILIYDRPFPQLKAQQVYEVSPEIMKKITGLKSPDGIAAVISFADKKPLSRFQHLLVLDQIADPGNVGTLFRSALALGWDAIFLTPNCVDPFNEKAIRASKGACFRLPFEEGSYERLEQLLSQNNACTYIADLQGKSLPEITPRKPLALILGSESCGPSFHAQKMGTKITIPIHQAAMESLNVASAGAILMYNLRSYA